MINFSSNFFLFFYFYLSIPLLLRAVKLKKNHSITGYTYGVAQDIFITCQQYLLFYISFSNIFFHYASCCLLLFMTLYYFVDYYFYKNTKLRFNVAFLQQLKHPHDFISSAKSFGIDYDIILLVILVVFSVIPQIFIKKCVISLPLLFYPSLLISSISIFISKNHTYASNNIFFQMEEDVLLSLLKLPKIFFKSKDTHFTPKFPCEKHYNISSHYPLLRHTQSFHGNTTFDLNVAKDEKPHIIFYFMESFRSHNIGCFNAALPRSPNFDKISSEGILFNNYHSSGILTDKALISTLFGIPSPYNKSFLQSFAKYPMIGIPDIAKKHGYNSVLINGGNLFFDSYDTFFSYHNFDTILGKSDITKSQDNALSTSWGVHDEYLVKYSIDTINNLSSPSFVSVITISNHHPWIMPPNLPSKKTTSISEKYNNYLNTYEYSDYCFGKFIEELKLSSISKNAIVFVLGDHGQPMGEHDNYNCQRQLYNENIHVPLLILADGKIPHPKTINTPASSSDLLLTLMDIMGWDGMNHSLGSTLKRKTNDKSVYFSNPYEKGYMGMRNGKYKYILTKDTKEEEFYNIEDDKHEKNNIINKKKLLAQSYKDKTNSYYNFVNTLYKEKRFIPENKSFNASSLTPPKNVTDQSIIKHAKILPNIFYLNLSNCHKITDESIGLLAIKYPDITSIDLTNCILLTNKSLISIADNCHKLLNITISGCSLINDEGISYLLSKCREIEALEAKNLDEIISPIFLSSNDNLNILNLQECVNLTDDGIISFCENSPRISQLFLNNNNVTDKAFNAIANTCKKLQTIVIGNNDKITNSSLSNIFINSRYLRNITLINLPNITDQSFTNLDNMELHSLNISSCHNIHGNSFHNFNSDTFYQLKLETCNNINGEFLKYFYPKEVLITINCPNIDTTLLHEAQEKIPHVFF
jgi:phosphoglycerol transferase MdoB-like AlkP superfamily enzyme